MEGIDDIGRIGNRGASEVCELTCRVEPLAYAYKRTGISSGLPLAAMLEIRAQLTRVYQTPTKYLQVDRFVIREWALQVNKRRPNDDGPTADRALTSPEVRYLMTDKPWGLSQA